MLPRGGFLGAFKAPFFNSLKLIIFLDSFYLRIGMRWTIEWNRCTWECLKNSKAIHDPLIRTRVTFLLLISCPPPQLPSQECSARTTGNQGSRDCSAYVRPRDTRTDPSDAAPAERTRGAELEPPVDALGMVADAASPQLFSFPCFAIKYLNYFCWIKYLNCQRWLAIVP